MARPGRPGTLVLGDLAWELTQGSQVLETPCRFAAFTCNRGDQRSLWNPLPAPSPHCLPRYPLSSPFVFACHLLPGGRYFGNSQSSASTVYLRLGPCKKSALRTCFSE